MCFVVFHCVRQPDDLAPYLGALLAIIGPRAVTIPSLDGIAFAAQA